MGLEQEMTMIDDPHDADAEATPPGADDGRGGADEAVVSEPSVDEPSVDEPGVSVSGVSVSGASVSGAAATGTEGASELRADLVSMIQSEVSLDPGVDIATDTDLLLSGLVDSLGVVQIVGWLEDRLDVQIDPVDIVLENFETVDSMVAFANGLSSSEH